MCIEMKKSFFFLKFLLTFFGYVDVQVQAVLGLISQPGLELPEELDPPDGHSVERLRGVAYQREGLRAHRPVGSRLPNAGPMDRRSRRSKSGKNEFYYLRMFLKFLEHNRLKYFKVRFSSNFKNVKNKTKKKNFLSWLIFYFLNLLFGQFSKTTNLKRLYFVCNPQEMVQLTK